MTDMIKKTVTLFLLFAFTALFAAVGINHATKKELQSVKVIGPQKAQRIIRHREKHCFQNADELVKICGISKKTFKKIESQVKAEPCNKK